MRVRTITPIKEGEELTVTYLPELDCLTDRQARTRLAYGFKCNCVRCTEELRDDTGATDLSMQALCTKCGAAIPIARFDGALSTPDC